MYLRYRPPGQSRQIEESFPRIEGESMPDYRKRAQVALAKASLSMASGTRVAPTSRTVDELAASYLASIGTEVKARTFEGYESFIRVYILPVLGAKRVARLTTDDIRGFKRHLLGRKVAGDRLMAVSTAREAMSRLRDMINYAMDGTDSREYWGSASTRGRGRDSTGPTRERGRHPTRMRPTPSRKRGSSSRLSLRK